MRLLIKAAGPNQGDLDRLFTRNGEEDWNCGVIKANCFFFFPLGNNKLVLFQANIITCKRIIKRPI